MKHADVLIMVVNLLIGVWAILYFQQRSRRFHDAGLQAFLGFLIVFNLFEFLQFILIYFFNNLTPVQYKNSQFVLKWINWPLRALLLLAWYFLQYRIIAWQRDRKLPRWVLPVLLLFTAAMSAFFLLGIRVPAYFPRSPLLNFWNLFLWPMLILQSVWLAQLLVECRSWPDPSRRRAARALAWLFLSHILIQFLVLLLEILGLSGGTFYVARLLILYTNLLPIFWLNRFYIPWAGAASRIGNASSELDLLQKSHGLSTRELEILKLILDGKTNRQMEEQLYISIHTVKSHVYNLYRKLGVKNYRQLSHFVATRRQENS